MPLKTAAPVRKLGVCMFILIYVKSGIPSYTENLFERKTISCCVWPAGKLKSGARSPEEKAIIIQFSFMSTLLFPSRHNFLHCRSACIYGGSINIHTQNFTSSLLSCYQDNNFSCGHNRGIYYFVCIACQEKNCWKLSKFAPSTARCWIYGPLLIHLGLYGGCTTEK